MPVGGCFRSRPAGVGRAVASNDCPKVFIPNLVAAVKQYMQHEAGVLGEVTEEKLQALRDGVLLEDGIARSPGHCMTMGTASTMACVSEALGMMMPGGATAPHPASAFPVRAAPIFSPAEYDVIGGPCPTIFSGQGYARLDSFQISGLDGRQSKSRLEGI